MTQDEIIEMARQANILEKMGYENPDMKNWRDDVLRELSIFAKLVAEAEKERIAKKIEKLPFGDTAQSFAIWVRNDT